MRTPTPRDALYDWHSAALRGERPPVFEDEPQAGWFKMRMVANGPWVPVVIWCHQRLDDETGELADDEIMLARVADDRRNSPVNRIWMSVARRPISREDYNDLLKRLTEGPIENRATHKPIDLLSMTPRP